MNQNEPHFGFPVEIYQHINLNDSFWFQAEYLYFTIRFQVFVDNN